MNKRSVAAHASAKAVPLMLLDELTDCALHDHDFYEFAVTVKDGFYHVINGSELYTSVGNVVLIRPSDSHALFVKDGGEHACLNIMIPSDLFAQSCASISSTLLSQISSVAHPIVFGITESTVKAFLERISNPLYIVCEQMLSGEQLEFYRRIRTCLSYEMIGYLLIGSSFNSVNFSPCIGALLAALDDESSLSLSISELAVKIGYSPSYLSRQFRSQFNMTLEQYMISQRLARAKSILLNSSLPIEKISSQVGWKKTGSFIVAFKKVYGISPGKYRASLKIGKEDLK